MTTPVDTLRRFYDAPGRGDVPSVVSLLDAQVEWSEAERFPCRVGGGALDCSCAGLRPPHKLDVQFSRIQLS